MLSCQAFTLLGEREIPERKSRAALYRHRTGAEVLSIANRDENKTFGIGFRTPVADATGVAHILEHIVLEGSEKYPIKSPFEFMSKSSVYSFLNASTYPDYTIYPVSSPNLRDFYNLVDVYLAAVLRPRLARDTFQQEGWRYVLDDPDAPLEFSGVVYNEMKGFYSTPDNILEQVVLERLLPELWLGRDSGGAWEYIPTLSHDMLRAYHAQHYRPSNSRVFFWGDDPSDARLRLIDDAFSGWAEGEPSPRPPLQPRFEAPRRHTAAYPKDAAASEADKAYVTVTWKLDEPRTALAALEHGLVADLLLGTPASTLRRMLVDSGLGEDTVDGDVWTCLREPFIAAGLRGVLVEDVERIEPLVLRSIEKVARDGFAPDDVAAALNRIEFTQREPGQGLDRGMAVLYELMPGWMFGRDPLEALGFESAMSTLRSRVTAEPEFLQTLVRTLFLENTHRLTTTLLPDAGMSERQARQEREHLDRIKASMAGPDIAQLIEQNRALAVAMQAPDDPEALARMPTLRLEELGTRNRVRPFRTAEIECGNCFLSPVDTNGLVYIDLGFRLDALGPDQLALMPVFGRAILETGTAEHGRTAFERLIGIHTGGLVPRPLVASRRNGDRPLALQLFRGKALGDKVEPLFDLLAEALTGARLGDRDRIRQIAIEEKARIENALVDDGSDYVRRRLDAGLGPAGAMDDQVSGIAGLLALRRLIERIDADWDKVRMMLEDTRRQMLTRDFLVCSVTGEPAALARAELAVASFGQMLPKEAPEPVRRPPADLPPGEGLTIPSAVNFVGKGFDLAAVGYVCDGTTILADVILERSWIHEKVRVEGGAYGGNTGTDLSAGTYFMLSYRDPHILETLDAYDRSAAFLGRIQRGEDELSREKVGALRILDPHLEPHEIGWMTMRRYLTGLTEDVRQARREQILGATVADLRRFGEALAAAEPTARTVVLGPTADIEAALIARPGLLAMQRIL